MTSVTDNFNRGNGGVGSNWTDVGGGTTIGGMGGLEIFSNQAFGSTFNSGNAAYWSADFFDNDQYSQAVLGTSATGGGPLVRGSSLSNTFYYLYWNPAAPTVELWKNVLGSSTQLDTATVTALPGDTLRLEVAGDELRGYRNGVLILSATDSAISGGAPGLYAYSSAVGFDSWGGGNLTDVVITGTMAAVELPDTFTAIGTAFGGTITGTMAAVEAPDHFAATGTVEGLGVTVSASGPDIPEIQCRVPDGCCGPSPCDVTEELFICQVRSLAPEGQVYNNTTPATPEQSPTQALGATAIGCNYIGCQQLIIGGCCGDVIPCEDDPVQPQLALLDSFASIGFAAVEALCVLLRELDPCRAQLTIKLWAARFGITFPDPCEGEWSDEVLSTLICIISRLKFEVFNWDTLTKLGAYFGAEMVMRYAGQFDCPEQHPSGWWTMARDHQGCPPPVACPEEPWQSKGELISLTPPCTSTPLSLNIILSPGARIMPENCNLPTVPSPQAHDPEFYEAFKWLLPQILPRNAFWCVYTRDEANCIQ